MNTNTLRKIVFCARLLLQSYRFLQQIKGSQTLAKQTPEAVTPSEICPMDPPGNQIRLTTQILLSRSTLSISLLVLFPQLEDSER